MKSRLLSNVIKSRFILIISTLVLFAPRLFGDASPKGQSSISIGIVKDADAPRLNRFERVVKTEIRALLDPWRRVTFRTLNSKWRSAEARKNIEKFMNDRAVDIAVALGVASSNELSGLSSYSKPAIAANIVGRALQNLPKTSEGGSGTDNFTYVESPYTPDRDLALFNKMYEIKRPVILIPRLIIDSFPLVNDFVSWIAGGADFSIAPVDGSVEQTMSRLPVDADAVYVFPLIRFSSSEIKDLFAALNNRRLPSFAAIGRPYVEMGATAGLASKITVRQLGRRIALNILKISKGENAALLPVDMGDADVSGVVNMESVRKIDRFPAWEILERCSLINAARFPAERTVSLRSAVAEALRDNLRLKTARKDVDISNKDVKLARSGLFPQINISGSGTLVSQNVVDGSFGQQGKRTSSGSLSLSQIILAEPMIADLAIRKLLRESRKRGLDQTELDIALDAASAYITVLLAKSRLIIENENLEATRANLKIAKDKKKAGRNGVDDVNRWESELNINKIGFNNARTLVFRAKYHLNLTLNRPIGEAFEIADINIDDSLSFVKNYELFSYLRNPSKYRRLADFLVKESQKNLPELKQMEAAIMARERLKVSQKRTFFLPRISLNARLDQVFSRSGLPDAPNFPEPDDDLAWRAGLSLSLPLFQGGKRKLDVEKTGIEIERLKIRESDLKRKLELRLRSDLDRASTSLEEIDLSEKALKAAEKNFQAIRDGYVRDVVDVERLVDAQRAALLARRLADDAKSRFLVNYLQTERSVGVFYFFAPEQERELFLRRLKNSL